MPVEGLVRLHSCGPACKLPNAQCRISLRFKYPVASAEKPEMTLKPRSEIQYRPRCDCCCGRSNMAILRTVSTCHAAPWHRGRHTHLLIGRCFVDLHFPQMVVRVLHTKAADPWDSYTVGVFEHAPPTCPLVARLHVKMSTRQLECLREPDVAP